MPMAAPMMSDSLSGVSSTRASPYLAHRPSVARKTPPFLPTSSPSTTTSSSRPMAWSSVCVTAWIRVRLAMLAPRAEEAERREHRAEEALGEEGANHSVRPRDAVLPVVAQHLLLLVLEQLGDVLVDVVEHR